MKIYTKTGDLGETGLFGGRRVMKNDLRVDAYGTVDELNANMGLLADAVTDDALRGFLRNIQNQLFVIGSNLANDPDKPLALDSIEAADITRLETAMDEMDTTLPPLRNFILPGGHLTVSYCHLARTVCRRAERLVVALSQVSPIENLLIQYLNRLSDYLFILARKLSIDLGVAEIAWRPRS